MEKHFNLKLILLLIPAFWLISAGGEMLGFLVNPTLAEQLSSRDFLKTPHDIGENFYAIIKLSFASAFAGWIALVLALVVALIIGKKKRWHWVNGVSALVLVYAGSWMKMEPFARFFDLLHLPGEQFSGLLYYVVNAAVLIFIGGVILLITALKFPAGKIDSPYLTPQTP